MIIEIPDDNSIVKWRYEDNEDWKSAEISDLIKTYERPQGEWIRLDSAKRVIAKFKGYLDEDMILRIQIALEKEYEAKMKGEEK